MKKLFILLSTFFLSFFFAWIIVLRAPQYLYASYDSVTLLRVKKEAQEPTREVFEQELEKFVNSEQSLIARRIVEPSKDGTTHFTYAIMVREHYQNNSKKLAKKVVNVVIR